MPPTTTDKTDWPLGPDKHSPIDNGKKPPVYPGIAIPPPPPPPVVDVESQQSLLRGPPHWKRLLKNKTFQMIGAAFLAVTIGLVVAATVDKVPEEAKEFLALPGYMWLRAVKATGTFECLLFPQPRTV